MARVAPQPLSSKAVVAMEQGAPIPPPPSRRVSTQAPISVVVANETSSTRAKQRQPVLTQEFLADKLEEVQGTCPRCGSWETTKVLSTWCCWPRKSPVRHMCPVCKETLSNPSTQQKTPDHTTPGAQPEEQLPRETNSPPPPSRRLSSRIDLTDPTVSSGVLIADWGILAAQPPTPGLHPSSQRILSAQVPMPGSQQPSIPHRIVLPPVPGGRSRAYRVSVEEPPVPASCTPVETFQWT